MKWNYFYLVLVIIFILLIGIIHIPSPFCGDQAFFLLGAKEMNEGMVLYRDFWDIKQPGIFFFYLLAGKIFGFTEIGVHSFELIYWIAFTVVLIWFLKRIRAFKSDILAYLAPIFILGTYYAFSYHRLLTQVEALVGFPLLLVLIFNYLYIEGSKFKHLWLVLSGIAGGLVLFFKIIFAPILIAFWGQLLLYYIIKNKRSLLREVFSFLLIPIGISLAWLPFLIYGYKNGILALCYETFIKYPPLIIQHGEKKTLDFLFKSIEIFYSNVAHLAPLCLLSSLLISTKKQFNIALWLWLLLGSLVVAVQSTSWYPYQFQLLYFPLILIALLAVDFVFEKIDFIIPDLWMKNTIILKSIFILFLVYPIMYSSLSKLKDLKGFNFGFTNKDRIEFYSTLNDNREAIKVSNYLNEKKEMDCPIFVINDPLVYFYTGRNQAIAQSGWSMQLFIPGQMDVLLNELKIKTPCYIFINRAMNPFLMKNGSPVIYWITNNYSIENQSELGIWYRYPKSE